MTDKSQAFKNFRAAAERTRVGFVFRHPILTALALGAVIELFFVVEVQLHPPTAQQIRQMKAEQAAEQAASRATAQARAAADAAKLEQERYLCRIESVCEKYGKVRQDCATAGSFDNCIRVRMGDDDVGLVDACTNDGNVLYPSEHMPSGLRCFFLRH